MESGHFLTDLARAIGVPYARLWRIVVSGEINVERTRPGGRYWLPHPEACKVARLLGRPEPAAPGAPSRAA